jgi:hypothetical protein
VPTILPPRRANAEDMKTRRISPTGSICATMPVEDFEVAEAAYRAAAKRWPKAAVTLRAFARVWTFREVKKAPARRAGALGPISRDESEASLP